MPAAPNEKSSGESDNRDGDDVLHVDENPY
jgi:hypothetical protein